MDPKSFKTLFEANLSKMTSTDKVKRSQSALMVNPWEFTETMELHFRSGGSQYSQLSPTVADHLIGRALDLTGAYP